MVPFIYPDDAWHIERHVQCTEKLTTSKRSAEVAEAKSSTTLTYKKTQHQDKDGVDKVNINQYYPIR